MEIIILIVVGVLVLGVGIYVYTANNNEDDVAVAGNSNGGRGRVNNTSVPNQTAVNVGNESFLKVRANNIDLQTVIDTAVADGVLTASDRGLIKQTALGKGFDYAEVFDDVERRVRFLEIDSETELVDLYKKNRHDFEKLVRHKFCRVLFNIKEWAGEKYEQGVNAEISQFPDMLVEFIGFEKNIDFAVKCKWRQTTYKSGVAFGPTEQLNRYRDYAKEKNVPVFLVIGLAGKGAAPQRLFIIPLKNIRKPFMKLVQLKKYEKKVGANFYFDFEKKELK